MLDLKKIEHDIQLDSYNLNTISLVKNDENKMEFQSPYTISSDQIEFKMYPMVDDSKNNVFPMLIRFMIKNDDFKLKLEYKAVYKSNTLYMSENFIDMLNPIVFFTMYQNIKKLSTSIIEDIVNSKVDFPIFDKRKLTKLNDSQH
ncbi:hypothetical protein QJ729_10580 [Staphylococcus hominis]|uniref:hypothetical protein n=1 Tax=Staphylococcus hominis TaxID=1290 RepID=UPI0034CF64BA